jgi:hypothetical protein
VYDKKQAAPELTPEQRQKLIKRTIRHLEEIKRGHQPEFNMLSKYLREKAPCIFTDAPL